MMLVFDEVRLARLLDALDLRSRVAFAAACAERLSPAFRTYAQLVRQQRPEALASVLEQLWGDVEGLHQFTRVGLDVRLETTMSLIPREDEPQWNQGRPPAENAASAVAYALRCRQSGRAQEAVWAARQVYEAIDQVLLSSYAQTISPAIEGWVIGNAVMQAELGRQQRDLVELGSVDASRRFALVATLRERARREPWVPL